MDTFRDRALLCSFDSSSGVFQLRHGLVQRSLGIILRQVGKFHIEEPLHLQLERDDAPVSGHGLGLTIPSNMLLFFWHSDRHCCDDLIGMSPTRSSWRQITEALRSVHGAKHAKHS